LKALILAAGLGTRLMPLTASIPKALVSINGVTLLEITIRKLTAEGFRNIIVNVHHHAGQVVDYLKMSQFGNVKIAISDETDQLLDTGGAIMKARWFLDGNEPFLVHNVDVISNISLKSLLSDHIKRKGLATLSVMDRQTRRYFLFDESLKLRGWKDTFSGETRWPGDPIPNAKPLAFSGIHIIDPRIFNLIEEQGRFSIVDTYLRLAGSESIFGHMQPGVTWFDLGKPDQFELVSGFMKDHPEFIA